MLGLLTGHWWALMLLGIVAGIISGMLGLGSGAVVVPALVLLFGYPQKSAQGTALALMVPMALLGAFRYWRNPDIGMSMSVVGLIVLGALPGVLIGTHFVGLISGNTLRKVFAVFLAIVAVKMFTASPKRAPQADGGSPANQNNASVIEPGGQSNESTEQ